jgi:hypothetical protein
MRPLAQLCVLAATAVAQEPSWHIVDHEAPTVAPLAADSGRAARFETLIDGLCLARSLKGSRAADELSRLGPPAIPWLLKHLDDERETGLEVRGGAFAKVYAHAEVPVPPGRPAEREAMAAALECEAGVRWWKADTGEEVPFHVVTVGDLCFAVLGRIVNRPYEPVRSPTTTLTIVSSPSRDPRIAEALRGWWGSGDPRRILLRSLLADFHTRGRASTAFQAAAGARLITDFPDEAAAIVAKRVAGLPWGLPETDADGNVVDDTSARMILSALLATGHPSVRAEWLKLLDPKRPRAVLHAAVKATRTFDTEAQARVREIAATTADLDLFAECLVAVPGTSSPEILARLEKGLAEHPDAIARTDLLLAAVVETGDEGGLGILRRFMEGSPGIGWARVLSALDAHPRSAFVLAIVPPFLGDEGAVPAQDRVRVPEWVKASRTCDWAAALIAKARPGLRFDPEAPVEERDRRIAAIRAALAK